MRVWRISNYADLSGVGGTLVAARSHHKGFPILYTAEHPAGAMIEFLSHIEYYDIPSNFQLLKIEIPDSASIEHVDATALPPDWRNELDVTRSIGDRWLKKKRALALRVPSVIVPHAQNILLNPSHAEMASVAISSMDRVPLDPRFVTR